MKACPGRCNSEQEQEGLSARRKMMRFCEIFDRARVTSSPSSEVCWRCAVRLCNGALKQSHFYDVMRNPNYNIGKRFLFPATIKWLDKSTLELDPIPEVTTDANHGYRNKRSVFLLPLNSILLKMPPFYNNPLRITLLLLCRLRHVVNFKKQRLPKQQRRRV